MSHTRVAIFHDYFSFIGGGEKLVLTLARHLGADVITTDVERGLISKMGFSDVNVLSLGSLVKAMPLKQIQATLKFATCDFRGKYDFYIFSGNWAHYAAKRHRPNLMYCYTPVRVFYDQRRNTINSLKNPLARLAAAIWTSIHSRFDKKSIKSVERIATTSNNTAKRIEKYYNRRAVVVYPPCDTSRFHYLCDDGFWLSVNRLYPEKRIEIQLKAFERMPDERLIIVGNSGNGDHSVAYAKNLKAMLPPNVSIYSDMPEEKLIDLYGRCRGVISTAVEEDFGMTAVEAMASGKPVIAPREGGYLESIIDGETGLLIECTPEALIKAVKTISKDPSSFKEACIKRAEEFDVSVFIKNIKSVIQDSRL
ncbi:Glycosyltransferase [Methanocella conradii HZ254]|uniref:Glycosyltransferase n=1 Tax=Methanocella conradii (strain DSM 24694 / JCM 17849 / CGMCC 1.5162 / HZ254) TaxID=1041930 RepID=H8I6Q1_METCZ|nr:glycosyltransferase [Methanocella conradii]AFC99371.1 Glycosyltransferase [Methanocella conradii HZ254]